MLPAPHRKGCNENWPVACTWRSKHTWWVGNDRIPDSQFVSLGLLREDGSEVVVTRGRATGCSHTPEELARLLCGGGGAAALDALLGTTLIRDELISRLSLDLSEHERFEAVRSAVAGSGIPDYAGRTEAILRAAKTKRESQEKALANLNLAMGAILEQIAETRGALKRSGDAGAALRDAEAAVLPETRQGLSAPEALRRFVVDEELSLREAEAATKAAEALVPEFRLLRSEKEAAGLGGAREALDRARSECESARARLVSSRLGVDLQRPGRASETHLAILVEHGSALGLREGRCPLCDAARTDEQFQAAIACARERLADWGRAFAQATAEAEKAADSVKRAEAAFAAADERFVALTARFEQLDAGLEEVARIYKKHGFDCPPEDPATVQTVLLTRRDRLARLRNVLSTLEASREVDRLQELEKRLATLRDANNAAELQAARAEKAVEAAQRIHDECRVVGNKILEERFETVVPLLKEIYRRLRPHPEWDDIDTDFGGKVKASLNLTVGGKYNPQFLFSSGQRRAAGLAFLLATHLSRTWSSWNTLVMDDPVQHIDDYRALNLAEVLYAIRREGRQVIVAVEDPALAELLTRRLSSGGRDGRHYELATSDSGGAEILSEHTIPPMMRRVLKAERAS